MSGHRATVYVGNLPWSTTEDDLVALFAECCPVVNVRVIQDRFTFPEWPAVQRPHMGGELSSAEAQPSLTTPRSQ